MTASRIELQAALDALVARDPDRASSSNDIGFSQAHTHLGHALAATPAELWSAAAEQAAQLLCWLYRRQLIALGLDVVKSEPATKRVGITPGEVRRWIDLDQPAGEYRIFCSYVPDLVSAIKKLPGRRWDTKERCWRVPLSSGQPLRAMARERDLPLTAAAGAAPIPVTAPAARPAQPPRRERLISLIDERHLRVHCEYNPDIIAELHRLRARWEVTERCWRVPVYPPQRIERLAEEFEFGFSVEAAHALDLALHALLEQDE